MPASGTGSRFGREEDVAPGFGSRGGCVSDPDVGLGLEESVPGEQVATVRGVAEDGIHGIFGRVLGFGKEGLAPDDSGESLVTQVGVSQVEQDGFRCMAGKLSFGMGTGEFTELLVELDDRTFLGVMR